ncbi:hypothetical protein Trydic_g8769 [Trypoxylus dichotomus]
MKHIVWLLCVFFCNVCCSYAQFLPAEGFLSIDADYEAFVCKVVADKIAYPAIVVNGGSVVTSTQVQTAKKVDVCYRSNSCQDETTLHRSRIDFGVIYVQAFIGPYYRQDFLSRSYQDEIVNDSNCVSVTYNRRPSKVIIGKDFNLANCNVCGYMDAIFCDTLYVGVIAQREDDKFLLSYRKMLEYVEENVVNDSTISVEYPDIVNEFEGVRSDCGIKCHDALYVMLIVVCINAFRISILH